MVNIPVQTVPLIPDESVPPKSAIIELSSNP